MARYVLPVVLLLASAAARAADAPVFCQRSTEFVAAPVAGITYPPAWVAEMIDFLRTNCPPGTQVKVPNRVVAEVCDFKRPLDEKRRETTCIMAPH